MTCGVEMVLIAEDKSYNDLNTVWYGETGLFMTVHVLWRECH
jgi:hypothetical protein